MASPFYAQQFTFTQPDGTKLKVKGWGDQHHAVFETLDGYSIIQDPISGFYQYATRQRDELKPSGIVADTIQPEILGFSKGLRNSRDVIRSKVFSKAGLPPGNARWKQRRERARNETIGRMLFRGIMPAPPKRETVGNFIGLCLLIQFPDVAGAVAKEEVEKFCNQKGYTGFGNNGSVNDYFFDNSGGKLNYTNIVAPYYTAKNPRKYYTNEAVDQPIRAIELIEEALDYHKSQGFDFTALTSDNENYVYALNIFYAGEVVNNWAKGLWPHSYYLNSPYELVPGKLVHDYQITNMDTELSLGTFCHENGHMICNFPDLYDYGYESRGVGSYCLMCSGGNADKKNPAQIGAYLKYKAGWAAQVSSMSPGLHATINAGQNEFFIFNKNMVEYYIIENRIKAGRDFSLPDEGLVIWHVDELGDNQHEQMSSSLHYECSLIQADGKNELEHGINDGDYHDLFDAPTATDFGALTNPNSNWWDGTNTGLEIFDISAAGITMNFSAR